MARRSQSAGAKGWSIKNIIMTAIAAVVGTVVMMICMAALSVFGNAGHNFAVPVAGIFNGIILVYLFYKVQASGVLAFFQLLQHAIMCLMGGFYLPWVITTVVGVILGELIMAQSRYFNTVYEALAFGVAMIGSMCGAIIPALFFADSFYKTWVDSGMMTAENMTDYINLMTDPKTIVMLVVACLVCAFIGIALGHKLLKRYQPQQVEC